MPSRIAVERAARPGRSTTSVAVSSSSKTRSAAPRPCWIVRVGLRQALERIVEQEQRGEEGEEGALRAAADDDAVAAVPDDAGDPEGGEDLHHRIGEGADRACPSCTGGRAARSPRRSAASRSASMPNALTTRLPWMVSCSSTVMLPIETWPFFANDAQPLRQPDDRQHRGREDDEGDQRQQPVLVERDDHQDDQRRRVLQHRRDGIGERGAHQGDVVGDARDDGAGRRAVEERQRQMLDVIVQRVAQVGDDALADVLGQVGAAEADDAAEEEDADDRRRAGPSARTGSCW